MTLPSPENQRVENFIDKPGLVFHRNTYSGTWLGNPITSKKIGRSNSTNLDRGEFDITTQAFN